jgi:hypothetical protein
VCFFYKKKSEGIDNKQACTQKKKTPLFSMPLLSTIWGLRGRKADHDQRAGVEGKKIKIQEEHRKTDGDESQHSVPVPPEVAAALKQVR